jgi:hypothetical protein
MSHPAAHQFLHDLEKYLWCAKQQDAQCWFAHDSPARTFFVHVEAQTKWRGEVGTTTMRRTVLFMSAPVPFTTQFFCRTPLPFLNPPRVLRGRDLDGRQARSAWRRRPTHPLAAFHQVRLPVLPNPCTIPPQDVHDGLRRWEWFMLRVQDNDFLPTP